MIKSFVDKYWIVLFGGILLLSHIPFLSADPPDAVSWSRGPWTDEGIYLSQIRNAINQGTLDINESDCLAKTPLFNLLIYPVFLVFGAKLMVARCFVLFSTLFTFLFVLYKSKQKIAWVSIILFAESQFYFYQYSHFAQAEILQCNFMLLSLFYYTRQNDKANNDRKRFLNIFLSCLFMAFAYYTKISSSYLILVVPLSLFAEYVLGFFFARDKQNIRMKRFFLSLAFTLLFVGVYILCWYLPFKDTFELFNENEMSSVTGFAFSFKDYFNMLPYNYNLLLKDSPLFFYILLAFISFLLLFFFLWIKLKRKEKSLAFSPFLFTLIWFLLEMHKFGYHYLPPRYLIFSVLALCSLAGFVFQGLFEFDKRLIGILLFVSLFIIGSNMRFYVQSYQNRHFQVAQMNDYLARYDLKNETIIGPWAPSATWKCASKAIPIWKDYYYHEDPIKTFHPRIIISELEETDSDSAYIKQGINLRAISDSSRQFNIHFWKPVIYWLKKNK